MIAGPADQPALLDAGAPTGVWKFYPDNGPFAINNHANGASAGGTNIVYIDGHGTWKSYKEVSPKFATYKTGIYW